MGGKTNRDVPFNFWLEKTCNRAEVRDRPIPKPRDAMQTDCWSRWCHHVSSVNSFSRKKDGKKRTKKGGALRRDRGAERKPWGRDFDCLWSFKWFVSALLVHASCTLLMDVRLHNMTIQSRFSSSSVSYAFASLDMRIDGQKGGGYGTVSFTSFQIKQDEASSKPPEPPWRSFLIVLRSSPYASVFNMSDM